MKNLIEYVEGRLKELSKFSEHNKSILLDLKRTQYDRFAASEKFIANSAIIHELETVLGLIRKEEDEICKKEIRTHVNFLPKAELPTDKIIIDLKTSNSTKNNSDNPIMVYPTFGDEPVTIEPSESKLFGVAPIKPEPPKKGLCVDVGTKGNPGVCEYRGIDIETRKVVFHVHIPGVSTNNIGEFLAIVAGYQYAEDKGKDYFVYSDSQVAISWVRQKTCKTNYKVTDVKQAEIIKQAESYLKQYKGNSVQLWSTKLFGQIYADFNRKK